MARTQAAVAYVNRATYGTHDQAEMAAFLDIFHPAMSEQRKRDLIEATR